MKCFNLFFILFTILFHNKSISSDLAEKSKDDSRPPQSTSSSSAVTTSGPNSNLQLNISDEEKGEYVRHFNPPTDCYLGYRRLNEETRLIDLYNKFVNVPFEQLDENQYKAFVAQNHLFDMKASPEKQTFNLMLWARLAGCPLLGVSQCHPFFHSSLHIYDPVKAKEMVEIVEEKARKKFQEMPEDVRGSLIASYPYEKNSTEVGVKILSDDKTYFPRAITLDLRNNAIIYKYLNAQSTNVDRDLYDRTRGTHFGRHRAPVISYEFLQAYIIPLTQIHYLGNVLEALQRLPKSVVNLMRGKAIYLSKASGPSVTISSCSHNAPITSYLGFIPGIFIEHSLLGNMPKVSTLTRNDMTLENIIHETGHLIDQMVLRSFYEAADKSYQTIPFVYQYDNFIKFNGANNRGKVFTGNIMYLLDPQAYDKTKNDQVLGKEGFMTYYSEKDADEDFAEHFKFHILDKYDEENPAPSTPVTKKERKHKTKKTNETSQSSNKLLFKTRSSAEKGTLYRKWLFMWLLVDKTNTDYRKLS